MEKSTSGATVLVVDDDPGVRQLAGKVLRRGGLTVIEAEDGERALEAAKSVAGGVALLLTDVVMPGMNGAVLAATLRSEDPALPVIYMSSYTEDELEKMGIGEVGAAYLTKPFTPDILTMMVRGVLGP